MVFNKQAALTHSSLPFVRFFSFSFLLANWVHHLHIVKVGALKCYFDFCLSFFHSVKQHGNRQLSPSHLHQPVGTHPYSSHLPTLGCEPSVPDRFKCSSRQFLSASTTLSFFLTDFMCGAITNCSKFHEQHGKQFTLLYAK